MMFNTLFKANTLTKASANQVPAFDPIMFWHETVSDLDIDAFSAEFCKRHGREIESDQFWADRIKVLRSDSTERLNLAIENLPLPAAFREAATATRALIREARKHSSPFDSQLTLLYWLAAVFSFGIPYSKKLGLPGYNVMAAVPGAVLKDLSFSYSHLGYEKLTLLSKTDVKWLIECWGQPESHSTLHVMHNDIWRKYEKRLIVKQQERNEKFLSEIKVLLSPDSGK